MLIPLKKSHTHMKNKKKTTHVYVCNGGIGNKMAVMCLQNVVDVQVHVCVYVCVKCACVCVVCMWVKCVCGVKCVCVCEVYVCEVCMCVLCASV